MKSLQDPHFHVVAPYGSHFYPLLLQEGLFCCLISCQREGALSISSTINKHHHVENYSTCDTFEEFTPSCPKEQC